MSRKTLINFQKWDASTFSEFPPKFLVFKMTYVFTNKSMLHHGTVLSKIYNTYTEA